MEKIKIYNQLENREGDFNPTGNGIEPVFDYVKDEETGEVVYKEVGKTNLYDIIQASKDGTDIHLIIDKLNKGLINMPSIDDGLFCDTTALPRDIHEAGDMVKSINAIYEKDPILKELYPTLEEYEKAFVSGKVLEEYTVLANKKLADAQAEAQKVAPAKEVAIGDPLAEAGKEL